jgi:CHU_C Type IX secretion signal domain
VYRSVGYGTPWDGNFSGNPLPIGTYYYIIEPKNGRKPMTGYVDIVR